jgi:hypothetical protein
MLTGEGAWAHCLCGVRQAAMPLHLGEGAIGGWRGVRLAIRTWSLARTSRRLPSTFSGSRPVCPCGEALSHPNEHCSFRPNAHSTAPHNRALTDLSTRTWTDLPVHVLGGCAGHIPPREPLTLLDLRLAANTEPLLDNAWLVGALEISG